MFAHSNNDVVVDFSHTPCRPAMRTFGGNITNSTYKALKDRGNQSTARKQQPVHSPQQSHYTFASPAVAGQQHSSPSCEVRNTATANPCVDFVSQHLAFDSLVLDNGTTAVDSPCAQTAKPTPTAQRQMIAMDATSYDDDDIEALHNEEPVGVLTMGERAALSSISLSGIPDGGGDLPLYDLPPLPDDDDACGELDLSDLLA